ncbi:MAG: class II fructose-1,6-bisphosphate aldolase [Nanoarchaeota archaeon]|nr:class II fructose-1,6-bisphosphate aldolase [Nanoarchaeota archaeon]
MFVDTKKLLLKAQKGKYAVAHFNINNMEIVQGVVAAATKLKAPIILATSEGALRYAGMDYLYAIAKIAAESSSVPIALHLDHGKDLEIIKRAIQKGYSSVMIDASHEDFEKNIRLTKQVVALAHGKGISVEAELGTIGGAEDLVSSRNIIYTDPAKAKEFVERTGCDILAVAIGTSHGAYKFAGKASLRQDVLRQIRQEVKVPLVLHGASGVPQTIVKTAQKYGADLSGVKGVPDAQIRTAIRNGVTKINTDTDIRIAFDAGIRKALYAQPKNFDPRHMLASARELIQAVAEQRIKLFGSAGRR